MDLTKFLGQDTQEQSTQRLSKEEYAAQKKQEREELWGMIDGKAQEVFQNGDSLKGLARWYFSGGEQVFQDIPVYGYQLFHCQQSGQDGNVPGLL